MELWTIESLTEIGNTIGKFIYVDPWCRGEKDKRIAWILIEKPFKGGYPNHIFIACDGVKIKQRLDFWGIPFCCSRCHHTGHLIKNCRFRLKGRSKGHQKEQGRIVESDSEGMYIHDNLPSSQDTAPVGSIDPIDRSEDPRNAAFISFQTPEPIDNPSVPIPLPMDKGDFVVGTHSILIPSRSTSLASPPTEKSKGKGVAPTPTPPNSPVHSPVNKSDSDLDLFLLRNPSVLEPLTIHKPSFPPFPSISPDFARNITVRKKQRGGSRHFRGRSIATDLGITNLSLVEVPILESTGTQSLRAWETGQPLA